MPAIRLLAIDIDGTLVDPHDQLTPAVRDAVRRAAAAGIKIVLATGRRYGRALPLVTPLEIDAPLVTASGSLIKDPATHQTLFRSELDREVLRATLAHVGERGYDALLYGDTHAEGFEYYCPRATVDEPHLAQFLLLNAGHERHWPTLMHDPPPGIFAGFAMGERAAMLALDAELQQLLPGALYTHVLRSPRYTGHMCEIARAGVNKWTGVMQVAEAWGIAAEEVCAVGDDVNDLPMIEGAGLGVAMANAVEELRAAADRIAPSNAEDGLATVVEWILEGR
ncbi:MAG: Cof-type HAD-IIB family hydrolase [Pirellulales bacterium]|nr:Cof-type HAD-IIB family hydrolase [Pirellulales bacterium]